MKDSNFPKPRGPELLSNTVSNLAPIKGADDPRLDIMADLACYRVQRVAAAEKPGHVIEDREASNRRADAAFFLSRVAFDNIPVTQKEVIIATRILTGRN